MWVTLSAEIPIGFFRGPCNVIRNQSWIFNVFLWVSKTNKKSSASSSKFCYFVDLLLTNWACNRKWFPQFSKKSVKNQMVLTKMNLKIEYPPFCEQIVSNYTKILISRSINSKDWEERLANKFAETQMPGLVNHL